MTTEETVVRLERSFWDASSRADGGYYRANCSDDALFVFFFGHLDREQCAEVIDGNTAPWAEYRFDDVRVAELADDVATLSYKATARHEGEEEDGVMFVSSVYVRRDGKWKLGLHQQTPAQDG